MAAKDWGYPNNSNNSQVQQSTFDNQQQSTMIQQVTISAIYNLQSTINNINNINNYSQIHKHQINQDHGN